MDPDCLIVELAFRSRSGRSLWDRDSSEEGADLEDYAATSECREQALLALRHLGFEVVAASPFGASIKGPPRLVEEVFGRDKLEVPESLEPWIESARIPPPGQFYAGQGGEF